MDLSTRKRLDAKIGEMTEEQVKELALSWRRREQERKREEQARYQRMYYARSELLAREAEANAHNEGR